MSEAKAAELPLVMAEFDQLDDRIRKLRLKQPPRDLDPKEHERVRKAIRAEGAKRCGLINRRHRAEGGVKSLERFRRDYFWFDKYIQLRDGEIEPAVTETLVKKKAANKTK
ncbi:MAG: hypothetical protein ACYTE6_10480 [Planctomycetota bacterium]